MKTQAALIRSVVVFLLLPLLISPLGRMIGKVANVVLGPGPTKVGGALVSCPFFKPLAKATILPNRLIL